MSGERGPGCPTPMNSAGVGPAACAEGGSPPGREHGQGQRRGLLAGCRSRRALTCGRGGAARGGRGREEPAGCLGVLGAGRRQAAGFGLAGALGRHWERGVSPGVEPCCWAAPQARKLLPVPVPSWVGHGVREGVVWGVPVPQALRLHGPDPLRGRRGDCRPGPFCPAPVLTPQLPGAHRGLAAVLRGWGKQARCQPAPLGPSPGVSEGPWGCTRQALPHSAILNGV